MTRQEKLEWLARNVHKAEHGATHVAKAEYQQGNQYVFAFDNRCTLGLEWFQIEEWLSMREKLQNKPSWKDAPEWVEYMAQSGVSGFWEFFSGKADPSEICGVGYWMHQHLGLTGKGTEYQGEILGDWRDTLEKRPESTTKTGQNEMTVTKQQQLEWLANKITKWPDDMGVILVSMDHLGNPKFSECWDAVQVAITREEWQQERDKMQKQELPDNSWHERGEFPPAGTECEAEYDTQKREWYKARVIGVDSGECFLRWIDGRGDGSVSNYKNPSDFRPLRTEREKAIDEMVDVLKDAIQDTKTVHKICASALYDAGYRKQ